jgi:formylglycine-generating enzyme required for sulfatase activity
MEFCDWLSRQGKAKGRYTLPTEAQWEYACRAGTTTPFHCGNTISTDQANYNGDEAYGKGRKGIWRQHTTPVGSFPSNAWGLNDMHGNVTMWCQDLYAPYPKGDGVDYVGSKKPGYGVVRGGSWAVGPFRSAQRAHAGRRTCYTDGGLRICFIPFEGTNP